MEDCDSENAVPALINAAPVCYDVYGGKEGSVEPSSSLIDEVGGVHGNVRFCYCATVVVEDPFGTLFTDDLKADDTVVGQVSI